MEGIQLAEETTVTDFGALLDACDDAMVTLVARETRLLVHRAVLMDRSPVFGAMFRHNMLEASCGEVTIPDVEGPVLRLLLASLYTLQGPQLPGMALQLLVAADKYGVSDLKAACEQQLAAQLSVETAAAAVFLAIRHCCPSLRQAAIAYIKTNQVEVMATQGWADAVRMQPEDVDVVNKLLSETSSPTRADSTQPLGHTGDTASTARPPPQLRRPQPPPAALPRLLAPQSLTCESSTMEALEHAETTAMNLGDLLDACDDAVVTLVAGETRLVAHRAVLVDRSPMFAAMLAHNTLEASSGQVTIVDVEGPVLRQLLSYLYTLRAPQLPGMAQQLLLAADNYGVSGLKAACEQQLAAQLSVETAAAAAVLAVRHSCTDLRKAAVTFIKANFVHVVGTQGWADVMLSQPRDLIEVSRLMSEPPPEISAPSTQPHSGGGRHSGTAASDAICHTPPPEDPAVSRLRRLPADEKNRRLIQAAKEGTVGELEALLAAGADVAARNYRRETALHRAAAEGHAEAARWLIARGAPVDARCNVFWTPLHEAAKNGHTAVVRVLLDASAFHSARRCDGWTPLHNAADYGHAAVAAALLDAGADREARNNSGETPLDTARRNNRQRLVNMLSRR